MLNGETFRSAPKALLAAITAFFLGCSSLDKERNRFAAKRSFEHHITPYKKGIT
jgi:hypothetical protein